MAILRLKRLASVDTKTCCALIWASRLEPPSCLTVGGLVTAQAPSKIKEAAVRIFVILRFCITPCHRSNSVSTHLWVRAYPVNADTHYM